MIIAVGNKLKDPDIGYIYIIKNGEYYKIGRTINYISRFYSYKRTEMPNLNEVIFCDKFKWHKRVEQKLLSWFKNRRHRGEWFSLTQKDLKTIKSQFDSFHFWEKVSDSWTYN